MSDLYPIKFKGGKLVKYDKPSKWIPTTKNLSKDIDRWGNRTSLLELIEWVEEQGGKIEDAYIYIDVNDGYSSQAEIRLNVDYSDEEIEKMEREYEKKLKAYNQWLEESKETRLNEKLKDKQKRSKALATQEKNILKQLEKVRKQQQKLEL